MIIIIIIIIIIIKEKLTNSIKNKTLLFLFMDGVQLRQG